MAMAIMIGNITGAAMSPIRTTVIFVGYKLYLAGLFASISYNCGGPEAGMDKLLKPTSGLHALSEEFK